MKKKPHKNKEKSIVRHIRFPNYIWDIIIEEAKKTRRTMNGELIIMIEELLQSRGYKI